MTAEELTAMLWRRVAALEKLATAYRTGGHPSEKTLDELDETRAALAEFRQSEFG
jgi:hypothetical protein